MESSNPIPNDISVDEFVKLLRGKSEANAASLAEIEALLDLPFGFVHALIDENDGWAFVIKLSAVVESALGQILVAQLMNLSLSRHLRSLPMDGRIGKVQLAQDLGLVGPKSIARLRAINDIRNDFAHGVKVLRMSIAEYFDAMNNSQIDTLIEKMTASDQKNYSTTAAVEPKANSASVDNVRVDGGRFGKYILWAGACVVLLELAHIQRRINSEQGWRKAMEDVGQGLIFRGQGDEKMAQELLGSAVARLEKIGIPPKLDV